jgi:hypothetical protein
MIIRGLMGKVGVIFEVEVVEVQVRNSVVELVGGVQL